MFRTILCMLTALLMVGSAYAGSTEDCEQSQSPERTIKACTQLLMEQPRNARAYNRRGHAHNAMYDFDLALTDFNKAIEIDPGYADAYAGRGRARPFGDEDQAMADVNKAIELDPRNARAYLYRVDLHSIRLPDYQERVLADLSKAIELDPTNACIYVARGTEYAVRGQRDLAKSDFAKAIEIDGIMAQLVRAVGFPELLDEIMAEQRANPR